MNIVRATFEYDGEDYLVYGRSVDDCIQRIIDRMGIDNFNDLGRYWRNAINFETELRVFNADKDGLIDALHVGFMDGGSFEVW